jgi:hypothetical protein
VGIDWLPPWRAPRDGVLLTLHAINTVLGIAVALLTLCQSLGYCTANDVVRQMRERLIEILRWLGLL